MLPHELILSLLAIILPCLVHRKVAVLHVPRCWLVCMQANRIEKHLLQAAAQHAS